MRISSISIEKAIITQEVSVVNNNNVIINELVEKYGGASKTPRNSYLARRITDSHDIIATEESYVLLWPFFSSHFSLPLKVGEVVWCIFDREIKEQGWWITRIHSDEDGEDLSFSCYDRRYLIPQVSEGIISSKKYDEQSVSNAKKRIASYSTKYKDGNELKKIIYGSNSTIKYEPIPKYTKRSGDLVIQGSNNSLICLGTDRYWKKDDTLNRSNAFSKKIQSFSGAIDLVAGRGRSLAYDVNEPKRTASKTYTHTDLDFTEIEKGKLASKCEGDPDFYSDAARLYISMKTTIDDALSLSNYTPIVPSDDTQRTLTTGSTVFAKADYVRIVARKDDEIGVNGSIKLIKEGHVNKERADAESMPLDGCSISLLEDGVIHVAGQRIFLGLSPTDTQIDEVVVGENTDNRATPLGLTQPYIKFQELKQLFINLIYQIEQLRRDVKSHIDSYNSHTHVGNDTVTGAPVKTLATTSRSSLVTQEFVIDKNARQDDTQYDKMIEKIKSARIFGE